MKYLLSIKTSPKTGSSNIVNHTTIMRVDADDLSKAMDIMTDRLREMQLVFESLRYAAHLEGPKAGLPSLGVLRLMTSDLHAIRELVHVRHDETHKEILEALEYIEELTRDNIDNRR
jgi:hypothetical protein